MFYLLSFWELDVSQVHFLLSENIKKGSQEITVSFYYLIQNINVEGVMLFFCNIPGKHAKNQNQIKKPS
jgi:ferritin-like protein